MVGLDYMISKLSSIRLEAPDPGVTQKAVSQLSGLSKWVQGQEPRLVHIEHPSDHRLPLHVITRLLQSQTEAVRTMTRMFTFVFRSDDYRSNGIRTALITLVVQALCLILPRRAETMLPERLVETLSGSTPTSKVFALFEVVNILFFKNRTQPLWVLWSIDQSHSSDAEALVAQMRDCCKFSEVKPHILFASVANPNISLAMRQSNIKTLVLESADFEAATTPDVKTLVAQSPRLEPHEDVVMGMLQPFSQDPKMYQFMFRSIQRLDEAEVSNNTYNQPDQPETVFRMLYATLSEGERRQTARLLQ